MFTYGSMVVKNDKVYTYADYLAMDENIRCEIMDGYLFMMASPSRIHQQVLGYLHYKISEFLEGKPCRVYPAPFSVVLLKQRDVFNMDIKTEAEDEPDPKKSKWVFEPDITVVCDKSKLTKEGCVGAPDFIIEIVSPSNRFWDLKYKRFMYEENGVREYWSVDPAKQRVIKRVLNEEGFFDDTISAYTFQDRVPVEVLNGLVIDFSRIALD